MELVFKKSAEKEILKLQKPLGKKILKKVVLLKDDPFGQDSQKLSGDTGYRIRIGDYRVVYTIDRENKVVTIVRIRHRREVYKNI